MGERRATITGGRQAGKADRMLTLSDIIRVANPALATEPGGVSYEQLIETMKPDRGSSDLPACHGARRSARG
ncbi:MAG: hypothetical protein U0V87_17300 [Acidobacteriota bacterium]